MKSIFVNIDLTQGSISKGMLKFAVPLMLGNIMQQLYNIVDTLVVGRYIGRNALAAVGSAYTLTVLITSVISGLCMGSSTWIAMQYGQKDDFNMKRSCFQSFVGIAAVAAGINLFVFCTIGRIAAFMQIPAEVRGDFLQYLNILFWGIPAVFLYNYFANLLRATGNAALPVVSIAVSAIANIFLDLIFVLKLNMGVRGAAAATVIAQYLSGGILLAYYMIKCGHLHLSKEHMRWDAANVKQIFSLSFLTCIQQSVMNFGILLVQGIVNSFGSVIMAAFAAAVKIDTLAYAPVQDFGNAYSTYVAQNYGAGQQDRIRKGSRISVAMVIVFCILTSALVCVFAENLMGLFLKADQTDIIAAGCNYLRIEGACYTGIGLLFLLYGYFRAIKRPFISLVLTVVSLGTRVILAAWLSQIPSVGVNGIWLSIPAGWLLADLLGGICIRAYRPAGLRKNAGGLNG